MTFVRQKTDGTAIASLVLALLSVIIGPFGFIPAIICGHIARARLRRDPLLAGYGLALAALIIAYTLAAFFVIVMIWFLAGSLIDTPPQP